MPELIILLLHKNWRGEKENWVVLNTCTNSPAKSEINMYCTHKIIKNGKKWVNLREQLLIFIIDINICICYYSTFCIIFCRKSHYLRIDAGDTFSYNLYTCFILILFLFYSGLNNNVQNKQDWWIVFIHLLL